MLCGCVLVLVDLEAHHHLVRVIMSYVYCTYLSFSDVVAPIGSAAHNVCKGRLLIVSVRMVCVFLAAMYAVTVDLAVLWSGQG